MSSRDAADHQPGLHVCSVIKGLGPGGAERLLVAATRHAVPSVVARQSAVYALSGKQHLVAELREAGSEVHGLGVRRLADLRWVPRLVRTLRQLRPDVVHVHSPALAPVVRVLAHARVLARPRPAVVTTEHNAWRTYHPLTMVANAVTAALDDATVAVSDEVRASIRLARRVVTVRHGIDLDAVRSAVSQRAEVRAELGAGTGDVLVVTVANYRAQKNYPLLIAAAARVAASAPGARFAAVGQGPLAAEVEHCRDDAGLADRFVLTGYRPDAVAVLAAGDVFALSSDYEGLPVALMEALALGLPVVATRVGGVAETITDDAGILVPPGDADALTAALVAVVRDDALRRRLADGAARLAVAFDVRQATATLATIYASVTATVRAWRPGRAIAPTARR